MGRHKDEIVDLYSRFAAAEIGRHVEWPGDHRADRSLPSDHSIGHATSSSVGSVPVGGVWWALSGRARSGASCVWSPSARWARSPPDPQADHRATALGAPALCPWPWTVASAAECAVVTPPRSTRSGPPATCSGNVQAPRPSHRSP